MNESWEAQEHQLWNMIRFDRDAAQPPPTVEGLWSTSKGVPEWRTYEVVLVSVRTTWVAGSDSGSQRVSLTLRRMGKSNHKSFLRGLGFLREIPPWLFDLITRASPRDVDTPELEAYGGRKFGQPEEMHS